MTRTPPTRPQPRGHARVPRALPTLRGRTPPGLAGVEVLLPLVLDLGHRFLGLGPARPDGLERLGKTVAALVDGEVEAAGERDLALGREAHPLDEGAAHTPGIAGGLVVGTVQNRLP